MSTGIEWTDATWNPVSGCTKVSQGCRHCYAETMAHRLKAMGAKGYENGFRVTLHGDRLTEPLGWRKPRRVFVCSMGDLFHHNVPDSFIDRVFAAMASSPAHTFQVLTKRPQRMARYIERLWIDGDALPRAIALVTAGRDATSNPQHGTINSWGLANVWVGTSAEDQATADIRVRALLGCAAPVRFVSAEPLLGPIDLTRLDNGGGERLDAFSTRITQPGGNQFFASYVQPINWVIAGGESGHGARPMHPDWARGLRDQCSEAGVPFFFKQWGAHVPWCMETAGKDVPARIKNVGRVKLTRRMMPDGTFAEGNLTPEEFERVRREGYYMPRVGKKAAGDVLDGVRHHAWPAGNPSQRSQPA